MTSWDYSVVIAGSMYTTDLRILVRIDTDLPDGTYRHGREYVGPIPTRVHDYNRALDISGRIPEPAGNGWLKYPPIPGGLDRHIIYKSVVADIAVMPAGGTVWKNTNG